ncbi:seipin-2-like [Trifolium pratense]|uniref:seipin-2-like n=1 Tax=Trifolium pratense TaxID=57577 RepID=UPI001E68FF54|nr:seipin-2-like [Trifolium pratense]
MDTINPQNDDVFFDALDQCPFHHCSATTTDHTMPESPPSSSGHSDPEPSPSSPSSTTLRRRSIRLRSPENELPDTVSATTKSQNPSIAKENENFTEKGEFFSSSQSPIGVTEEERNEESTLTTATHDEPLGDSAESTGELRDLPSNSLDFVTGLVIRAIMFQIRIFFMLMKSPILFIFHTCMFFVDPFGTMGKWKILVIWILGKVWSFVLGFIGPSVLGWFNENKSFWNVAFRCGWGILWSIYVCCILFALFVSSLVFSGFLVKGLVEKPFQTKQVLNFDYTKQSPVAFVPIIHCSGVGGEHRSDENGGIDVDRWANKRVIPSKQKVQLTVSLLVPESGYNTKLGVFQIRVDYLSSNGKTIASSRQPCMLRYRSEPIRLITTFLKIVPLLTGYTSETQTLDAKMGDFVEGDVPTSCLKVTLEQRAEYLPGAGIPQIYDSSIFVESELPLIKRILWYWKLSLFIWIAMMAFVMELLFVLLCCWPMIIPRTRKRSSSSASRTSSQNNLQAPS